MKYMLLIYMGENAMNETEREQCYKDSTALCRELHSGGQFISANPLQPIATATSVRIREGKRLITDGPFAETKEVLAGFVFIEAADKAEALELASHIPVGRYASIEVRPELDLG